MQIVPLVNFLRNLNISIDDVKGILSGQYITVILEEKTKNIKHNDLDVLKQGISIQEYFNS